MRKFAIIIDGTRTPLNRESGILITNPSGLGVLYSNTFAQVNGGDVFVTTDRQLSQGQVVADLNFFGATPYASYQAFVDDLLSASSIQLCYDPCGTEYKADVIVASVTKGESEGMYLTAQIALNLLSLWYTEDTLTGTGSVSVTAGGQADTCVIVRTTTSLINPVLTLTDSASNVVAKADITGSTSGTFEYSNMPADSHIYDGTTDIISKADILYPVFGRTNKAFTIALSGASMTVTVRKFWRSV